MDNIEQSPTIKDLYPHLNEEQLKRAEENLERYVEDTLEVYEWIISDPEVYAKFKALTSSKR